MDITDPAARPDTGFELIRFELTPLQHYIQARKAVEDTDGWRAVTVIDEEDGVVTLAVGDWTTHEQLPPGQPMWITERRGVIAVPSERGNVFSTGYGREGTIFETADADKLHFATIKATERPAPEQDLLWTTLRGLDDIDRLLIAPRTDMRYILDVVDVMTTSTTWGDVKKKATRELYEEILVRSGRGSLDEYLAIAQDVAPVRGYEAELAKEYERRGYSSMPADHEPFDAEEVEGYIIGDWPQMVETIMERLIPRELAQRHGQLVHTVISGDYLHIPAEHAGPVVADLRDLGYRCFRDPAPFIRDMFRFEDLPPVSGR